MSKQFSDCLFCDAVDNFFCSNIHSTIIYRLTIRRGARRFVPVFRLAIVNKMREFILLTKRMVVTKNANTVFPRHFEIASINSTYIFLNAFQLDRDVFVKIGVYNAFAPNDCHLNARSLRNAFVRTHFVRQNLLRIG